jgi:hypothetical protein
MKLSENLLYNMLDIGKINCCILRLAWFIAKEFCIALLMLYNTTG